jgi:hypothetical protein
MALKEKNQPVVAAPAASAGIGAPPPGHRFNPDVDARLTKFMADNPLITETYTKLVKEHPDWAVRTLALRTMFKHEDIAKQTARQLPQVEEWVKQQPGLKERIEEKIRTTHPIMRPFVYIREAIKARGKIEFEAPANRAGTGVSV